MTKQKTVPAKKAPAKAGSNPFDFQAPVVDKALYGQHRESYAAAIWLSKYSGDDVNPRPWVIDRENVSAMPSPFWREESIKFGSEPGEPFTEVYMAEVLRAVPLGARKRQIVEDQYGKLHNYPIYTKPELRVQGKLLFHYQVLVSLPGLPYDELIVLGLRGLTRTLSWQHDGKRYPDFPEGAENLIMKYAADASKVVGGEMPTWCAWWVDLRGIYANDAPYYTQVGPGEGTYVQPFGADLRTSNEKREGSVYNDDGSLKLDSEGMPWTRYVGPELFEQYQEIYRNTVVDWIAEWSVEGMTDDDGNEGTLYNGAYGDAPIGTEEDEIPFG